MHEMFKSLKNVVTRRDEKKLKLLKELEATAEPRRKFKDNLD